MGAMKKYSQYDIVIVNLDPTIGAEIKKKRPCVVVSPDELNHNIRTITVCPLTTKTRSYPTRIPFVFDGLDNWVVVDQIRTIDQKRITKVIGKLPQEVQQKVKAVIKETFVD
jgi:mRNA interferase MazF